MHDGWLTGCITADNNHHFRGNPAMVIPVTVVLPQWLSPIPRYYREFHFRYRGFPAVTAVLPLSPLPCSSLIHIHSNSLTICMHSNDYAPAQSLPWWWSVQQPPLPQQTFFQLLHIMDLQMVDLLFKDIPDAVVHQILGGSISGDELCPFAP